MSKVGLHIVLGRRDGYGAFLTKIAAAEQRLAVVKAVDDLSPLREAKRIIPTCLTVGRLNSITDSTTGKTVDLQAFKPSDYPSARAAAERYFRLVSPTWLGEPLVDVWETFNEFSSDWAWQGEFFVEMMNLAEPHGLRLSHYAFSTGNPPQSVWPDLVPCLRETKRRGHFLSTHEYGGVGTSISTLKGTEPNHALRYRRLYDFLRTQDANPQLIISECGQDAGCCFIGVDEFIADYAWYDAELIRDPFVVGCCAWTLGTWNNANFTVALPALADYIIAHPTPKSHRVYLPYVARETNNTSVKEYVAALALGSMAWIIDRRIKAREK